MIEMWLDPEIMRIESQSALTDAQVRAMLDSGHLAPQQKR
jgi:hypothetical protein